MNSSDADIVRKGLWQHNPRFVQLLGLCPLVAVSNSVVNALGLGLATLAVLTGSNLLVSLSRQQLPPAIRLPALMLLITALTTCVGLVIQARAFALHNALGIFLPLIATNCVLHGRAEGFAARHSPLAATLDGLSTGSSLLLLLVVVGAIRELLGTGALFANMDQLLSLDTNWKLQVFTTDTPFLLAILPPGAFLVTGLVLALKNVIDNKRSRTGPPEADIVPGSKRVRVTGQI